MGRALKYLFRLAVLAALALIAYAYLDELPPPTRSVEVELAVPPGTGGSVPSAGPRDAGTPAPAETGGAVQE